VSYIGIANELYLFAKFIKRIVSPSFSFLYLHLQQGNRSLNEGRKQMSRQLELLITLMKLFFVLVSVCLEEILSESCSRFLFLFFSFKFISGDCNGALFISFLKDV
jgi:hypothetical protein